MYDLYIQDRISELMSVSNDIDKKIESLKEIDESIKRNIEKYEEVISILEIRRNEIINSISIEINKIVSITNMSIMSLQEQLQGSEFRIEIIMKDYIDKLDKILDNDEDNKEENINK